MNDRELGSEPVVAGHHLGAVRSLVDATLAARLPLEVLHRIGQIDVLARDSRLCQRPVEFVTGGAHERLALPIFLVSGLLADEHDARGRWTGTEHDLRRVTP